jgi:hypothetical protein
MPRRTGGFRSGSIAAASLATAMEELASTPDAKATAIAVRFLINENDSLNHW